jgi:hypothetical protein
MSDPRLTCYWYVFVIALALACAALIGYVGWLA